MIPQRSDEESAAHELGPDSSNGHPERTPRVVHAEAMPERDVPGNCTFAVKVRDSSMQPLFSEEEIIFVNPDILSS
jgi:hypothetical protein